MTKDEIHDIVLKTKPDEFDKITDYEVLLQAVEYMKFDRYDVERHICHLLSRDEIDKDQFAELVKKHVAIRNLSVQTVG